MTLRSLYTLTFLAFAAVSPALLTAQETSAKEEERMTALAREQDGWQSPRNKFSVGLRMLSSGAQVNFGNLGTVPAIYTAIPRSDGLAVRQYNDGRVLVDTPTRAELDPLGNGNQTSTPGGRYEVRSLDSDNNSVLTGSYLSYTPGQTRQWEADNDSQLDTPGYVAFNIYSATSDGGSASHKQGMTGGVEFQLSHDLGRGSRRFQLAVMAGVSLTDINGKSAGTVASTLNTYTDYFSLNGQTINENQLVNPSYTTLKVTDGGVEREINYETSIPLSQLPDGTLSGHTTPLVGGAAVNGRWQVKGAYFLIKVGPSVRTQITDRLGLSASLGLAGGYAGTRYTASEYFSVAAMPDVNIELTNPDDGSTVVGSTTTKFLTGYYADVNLEWAASETMGLFGGVTAQQLSDYEQKLGDRTANIDLGNSVGIRGGVSIRF